MNSSSNKHEHIGYYLHRYGYGALYDMSTETRIRQFKNKTEV